MNSSNSFIQLKLPRTFQTVILGLALGLAASPVTTLGYLLVATFLAELLAIFNVDPLWYWAIPLVPRVIAEDDVPLGLLGLVLIIALLLVIPATIGGGVIGIVLDRLASFRRLTTRAIDMVGALVGFAAGGYTAAFMFFPASEMFRAYLLVGDILLTGALGALVGIAHSRILAWWLTKRMRDQSDEAGAMGAYGRMASGFIVGGITLGLVLTTQPGEDWIYYSMRDPLRAAGLAMLGGVVASWILGSCLKRRTR